MKYRKKGLNPVILRFFNVYGPNQNFSNLKQGMISIYLAQILNSKKLFIKGSLNRFRDFIYIDDAIEAIYNLCQKNTKLYPIINIGTGKKTTIKENFLKLEAEIAKAATKGFLKKNTASRIVSRLSKRLKSSPK